MFKVLLVDDEIPVLETLQSSIAWQQFGIGSILTASDGRTALKILSQHKIDLLITDIRMPQMDGLELIRTVRRTNPKLHCILLTAYGEFSYARAALQLGVENYLLKPFHKEELEETIERAIENIYADFHSNDTLFRDNILLRWITGNISPEELSERSSLLNINVYLPYYCVVSILKTKSQITLASYRADCAQALSSQYELYRVHDLQERHFFILGGSSMEPGRILDVFRQKASEHGLRDLIVSVGPAVSGSDFLSSSYLPCIRLLESTQIHHGLPCFVLCDDPLQDGRGLLLADILSLFQIEDALERHGQYAAFVEKLAAWEQERADSSFSILKNNLIQLFSREFPKRPELIRQLHTQILALYSALYLTEPAEALMGLLEKSYLLYRYSLDQLNPIVRRAIDYIHQNYASGLSIKEFSAANKISANYLGYLFKQETGVFFNNYLLQYRLCKGLYLLQNTSLKIGEIAERTGFSNASYSSPARAGPLP